MLQLTLETFGRRFLSIRELDAPPAPAQKPCWGQSTKRRASKVLELTAVEGATGDNGLRGGRRGFHSL